MSAKKRNEPLPIHVKNFTVEEIDFGLRKLKKRIEEVNDLAQKGIRYDDAKVNSVETNIRETVREVFGTNSPEFNDHEFHSIRHGEFSFGDDEYDFQNKFTAGIKQTVSMLEGLIGRLEEKREDISYQSQPTKQNLPTEKTRRIFLVHGRDEEAKQAVARFLEQLELEPIILHEQPNEGRTIIEKFEINADVEYAVVLLTPDDLGYPKSETGEAHPRARQNVVLELGYFIGRLTRKKVCALCKGSVEIPSDYHGVVYTQMDEAGGWKLKLAKEIKQSGISIDLNLAI